MKDPSKPTHISQTSRLGHWLPSDSDVLNDCLTNTIEQAEKKKAPFHPVIREFQEMIESDPVMLMYFKARITRKQPQKDLIPPAPTTHRVTSPECSFS